MLWLGDYIYESAGKPAITDVRIDPVGTVDDLDGYRAKYRLDDPTSPFVANEFVDGAIASQAIQILRNDDISHDIEGVARAASPGFRYCDSRRNGYGAVDATADAMTVTYRAVKVTTQNQPVVSSVRFTLTPGDTTPQTEYLNG